jgi:dynein heavy chain
MYLELIENLKRLFDLTKGKFERKIKQYRMGIQKIVETQAIVTKMSEELHRKKPQLVEMNGVLKDIQTKIDSEQEVITPIYIKV